MAMGEEIKQDLKELLQGGGYGEPMNTLYSTNLSETSKEVQRRVRDPKKYHLESIDIEEFHNDDYDVWLVRKPAEVLLEEMAYMKFPRKARSSSKLVEISCRPRETLGPTDQLDCRLEPPRCQMFHIYTKIGNNAKHFRNLKPCAKIKGVVQMNYVEKLIDEFPILPDVDFLDGEQQPGQQNIEELIVPSSPCMPVSIASIRRRPVLDLKGLKERLKVFGGNQLLEVKRKRK